MRLIRVKKGLWTAPQRTPTLVGPLGMEEQLGRPKRGPCQESKGKEPFQKEGVWAALSEDFQ